MTDSEDEKYNLSMSVRLVLTDIYVDKIMFWISLAYKL